MNHEIPTVCPNCGHEYDAHLHFLVCPKCGRETPAKDKPVMAGLSETWGMTQKDLVFLRCLLNIAEKLDTIINRLPWEDYLPY